jgi:hypothetical protein
MSQDDDEQTLKQLLTCTSILPLWRLKELFSIDAVQIDKIISRPVPYQN